MKSAAVAPNHVVYGTAVRACARPQAWQHALRITTEARLNNMANHVTYAGAITACGSARKWRLILGILDAVESGEFLMEAMADGEKDAIILASAVDSLKKCDRWAEGLELIRDSKNRVVFNTVISTCANAGRYQH